MMDVRNELIERFFRYLAIQSQSDARSATLPSTAGQQELANLLARELRELRLDNVLVDDQATVTAVKRGNRPDAPKIGFVAHLDTVDVGLSPVIQPQIMLYDGADLCLNPEKDIWLRVDEHPEILPWKGQEIIFGDGTSVLGADNKAAIAVIMTVLARLEPDVDHGDIFVAFVPDEEIGMRGAKALDLNRFPCDFAYTIDCCELGEVVIENFNAAAAEIVFIGVSAHPMSAKGVLVNPLLMALDFIAHFDRAETPERNAGREGYFWFKDLVANDTEARLKVFIRDFDKDGFKRRKEQVDTAMEVIRSRYPTGGATCHIADTYHNIRDSLGGDSRPIELLFAALEALRIEPNLIPMRGGTDGAILAAKGIVTPNFFTGAYNFHSRFEFLPISAFQRSYDVARMISTL